MDAATGNLSDGDSRGLILRAGGLTLGVETVERRGPQLLAEASALAGYLAARRASATCTLVLACEPAPHERWPDEACPDRVSVDSGPPLDLRGFFAWCEGEECPAENLGRAGYVRIPLALPISLAPGATSSRCPARRSRASPSIRWSAARARCSTPSFAAR